MSQADFRVSEPRAVVEAFRRMLDVAYSRRILPVTLRASRWILEELARTPMEFGESREYLSQLDLHLRIAFVSPLFVEFAVNLPNRHVFVRRTGFSPSD